MVIFHSYVKLPEGTLISRWHLLLCIPIIVAFQVGAVDSPPVLSEARSSPWKKTKPRAEPKICRNPSMKYIKNIWSIYVKPPKRDKNLENILFSSAFVIVLSIQNMSRFNRSLCNISSCFPKFQWLKTSVSPQIGIRSGIPGIALFSDQHFNLQDLTCNRSMEICSSTCHQSHTGCSLMIYPMESRIFSSLLLSTFFIAQFGI